MQKDRLATHVRMFFHGALQGLAFRCMMTEK